MKKVRLWNSKMTLMESNKIKDNFYAPDFYLKSAIDNNYYLLANFQDGEKPFLVMFICNHCPYVKSIIDKISSLAKIYNGDVNFVAIMPNDTKSYPEDSFENMKKFALENDFIFPYLIDETQDVAKNFDTVCTPEFNIFDKNGKLVYKGRFANKDNIPENPADSDLANALLETVSTGKTSIKQIPSIGCSVKWKS